MRKIFVAVLLVVFVGVLIGKQSDKTVKHDVVDGFFWGMTTNEASKLVKAISSQAALYTHHGWYNFANFYSKPLLGQETVTYFRFINKELPVLTEFAYMIDVKTFGLINAYSNAAYNYLNKCFGKPKKTNKDRVWKAGISTEVRLITLFHKPAIIYSTTQSIKLLQAEARKRVALQLRQYYTNK